MNEIRLTGNVGNEPELRYSPGGKAVVRFNVADTTGLDDKKKTIWHTVIAFEQLAECIAENVHKGTRVVVLGRLNKASFEGRDGNKKEITEIVASDVSLSMRFGLKSNKPTAEAPAMQSSFETEEEPF